MTKRAFRTLILHIDKIQMTDEFWEARAHIAVGSHGVGPNGRNLLSPDCVVASEVDAWADDLIRELEEVKREAHKMKWGNHPSFDRAKSS
jgi:hypothetical protein